MGGAFAALSGLDSTYLYVYQAIVRYAVPILSLLLLLRAVRPMLTFRREPEIWAWLCLAGNKKLPITHWESIIGRSKRSDVVVEIPTISRNHAVLIRYDDGSWSITDTGSKDGVFVNGKRIRICAIEPEDVISIGGVQMRLQPISRKQELKLAQLRTKATNAHYSVANVLLLTLVQILICFSYLLSFRGEHGSQLILGFGGIILCQWLLMIFYLFIRKPSFEVETLACFLCTLGMAAIAATKPVEMG